MFRDRERSRLPEVAMHYARLLFSFRGRINRAPFLVVQLALLAFWLKFAFRISSEPEALDGIVIILMIWINLATVAKRLHDRDRNGWWAAAVFAANRLTYVYYSLFLGLSFGVDISIGRELPLVMLAVALSLLQTGIIIELFFMPGTDGRNRFGPDPLASAAPGTATDLHRNQRSVPAFLVQSVAPPSASRKLLRD
jgi:uncharacterized membrane protein YhaH (DUF805 family)